jgi:hypothetical protein
MRVLSLACLLILTGFTVSAQRVCGTDTYIKNYFIPEPFLQNSVGSGPSIPSRDTSRDEIIVIPVVVHVLFNNAGQLLTDAQVLSQLEVLNRDFRLLNPDKSMVPEVFKKYAADSRIVFCLAKVDPDGRPSTGIVKKYTSNEYFLGDDGMKFKKMGGSDAWDTKRYLNIWVCSLFGRSLGYATPPGGPEDKDGVVINFDVFGTTGNLRGGFNKGRTATHEVAHWLGLKHIWGEDDCGDDEVDDTPKQKSYNFGCPGFPSISNCSPNPNGDMFMNFMDLTDDACMHLFTTGQKNKMRSLFARGATRNSLLLSYQCDASLASGAALPQDSLPGVTKPVVIKLYPNPVIGDLHIEGDESTTLAGKSATLYTSTGKLVKKFILQSNKETIQLQLLPAGFYILKIGDRAEERSFKVVKI